MGVVGIVVLADQASKWLAVREIGPGATDHRIELLGRWVAFEYLENTGAAFGILDGQGSLLTIVAGVVVAVLLGYHFRSGGSSPLIAVSIGLLVGGALGNVIDRVRLGYVVDFIAVGIWPKFNLADSAVTIGVALLGWAMLREPEPGGDTRMPTVPTDHGATRNESRSNMMTISQREGG